MCLQVEFVALPGPQSDGFKQAMDIYIAAFPENERHPVRVIEERISNGSSKIFVGKVHAGVVFMALLWPLKGTQFTLLDYMAVATDHRGKKIGGRFLDHLRQLSDDTGHRFLLEVEDPAFGHNREERVGRIGFYRKHGARQLEQVHFVLPPLQGTVGTDMLMMIFPGDPGTHLPGPLVHQLLSQLFRGLYNREMPAPVQAAPIYGEGNVIWLI